MNSVTELKEKQSKGKDALMDYIQDCQDVATDLSGLVESAALLDNEGIYPSGVTTLLKVSTEMANDLRNRLDSVSLPEASS